MPGRMNNPIPSNLKSEAKKAAKILREFTEITSRNGPDKIIPGWSAPSAIGIAGLGGGFEIGIEVSDLVIILNHERAVEAFAKGGNLTLGGNFTVAIGPLGRNLEGDVALRSSAAVYTYCKSRGLFAGVSLEGTCLIERKETNSKFYGRDIRASAILFGDVPPPLQAQDLYDILGSFTLQYEFEEGRSYSSAPVAKEPRKNNVKQQPSRTPQNIPPEAPRTSNRLYPSLPKNYTAVENSKVNPTVVTAIYPFQGQQPGDLTFNTGDKIKVTTKTDSQFDWWEGSLYGRTGIFPANYVTLN